MQDLAEIEAAGFPMFDGLFGLEPVGAADHLVDLPEAKLRHESAHLLGNHAHEIGNVLRLAGETLAKLGVLSGNAHWTSIEMANAHHDATHGHERSGGETEFLSAKQRGDDDIPAGFQLAIGLADDAGTQIIEH